MPAGPMALRGAACAAAALIAFAANSLLARVALAPGLIDPVSFTVIRLASGALTLLLLTALLGRGLPGARLRWGAPLALFVYAIAFSTAYVRLAVGLGALILFGAVQLTMIGWGVARGERPAVLTWLGLACALGGLAALTVPGANAPEPAAAGLMFAAGVAWGAYSLQGRGAGDPLAGTAANFAWSLPPALGALAFGWSASHAAPRGIVCAAVSGSIASGLGYALWYAALPSLSATAAAVSQLVVPVLAGVGAMLLLGEAMAPRQLMAGAAILGGVAMALRPVVAVRRRTEGAEAPRR